MALVDAHAARALVVMNHRDASSANRSIVSSGCLLLIVE